MSGRPPSFTAATIAVIVCLAAQACLAQQATSTTDAAVAQPAPFGETHSTQPQDVLGWAIRQTATAGSITAQLRQRLDLFGQSLVGSGHHVELARDDPRKVRIELRFRVGARPGSMQQVSDGEWLWIYRQLGEEETLEKVELGKLSAYADDADAGAGQGGGATIDLLPLMTGGMAGYLNSLADSYQFNSATTTNVHGHSAWRLEGTWRPERLEKRWPEVAEQLAEGKTVDWDELPQHMPHRVVVFLDHNSGLLRRVQFQRYPSSRLPLPKKQTEIVAAIEWLGIETGAEVDPRQFVYNPGAQKPTNVTKQYVKRLKRAQ